MLRKRKSARALDACKAEARPIGDSNRSTNPKRRKSGPIAIAVAATAGLVATGVSADTLAQPKDDMLEKVAANYIRYRQDVAAIENEAFDNAKVTRKAHQRLGSHDPDLLASGWVAYAALVAADTPEFRESLGKELKKSKRRRGGLKGLLATMSQNPSYVRKLDGADEAVAAVLEMTNRDGARITALGEAFKSQAYAMQKTKWGKQRIASSKERLQEAQRYERSRGAPSAPDFERTSKDGVVAPTLASANDQWAADWGESADRGRMNEDSAEMVMDRVLNLAVRYSTDTLNPKFVSAYAKNIKSQRCLSLAKLTLNQCIAATRTPYEEAFCLGEHGLNDIATCVGWVSATSS